MPQRLRKGFLIRLEKQGKGLAYFSFARKRRGFPKKGVPHSRKRRFGIRHPPLAAKRQASDRLKSGETRESLLAPARSLFGRLNCA